MSEQFEQEESFEALEARRIISLLKNKFILPSGALGLEYYDGKLFPHHIFPDLGDYLPFFLFFDEDKFADDQIKIYEKTLKSGFLVSEFPSFKVSNLVKSYEYTDLILGLAEYHVYKRDEQSKALYASAVKSAIEAFNLDGKISSFYHLSSGFHIPILDTRDGTFVEILVEASEVLEDKNFVVIAQNIFKRLTSLPFFKKHGLLPTFHAPSLVKLVLQNDKRFNSAIICKNNTNSLFGFLALYRKTGDEEILSAIDTVIDSIKKNALVGSGGIAENFYEDIKPENALLTASFPVLDFLCDLYEFKKRPEDLEFAKNIAEFWIARQGKTGLFPHQSLGVDSFLDSETDMTIALYKLFQITKEQKYKDAGDDCFDGIIKYHGSKDYVLSVDINNGEVRNSAQRTKFLALFIKLLIVRIREGESLFYPSFFYNLIKDR